MPVGHLGELARLRHVDLGGQRRAAEQAQVDLDLDVLAHAGPLGDLARRVEFDRVTLAVAEAERVDREALRRGDREHGRSSPGPPDSSTTAD